MKDRGPSGQNNNSESRRNRTEIFLDCEIRQGSRPWKKTRLEDLSPDGFRIAWFPNCRKEIPVRIKIPGIQMLTAHVRWQLQTSVGCEFESPLHVAVFEHLVKEAKRNV